MISLMYKTRNLKVRSNLKTGNVKKNLSALHFHDIPDSVENIEMLCVFCKFLESVLKKTKRVFGRTVTSTVNVPQRDRMSDHPRTNRQNNIHRFDRRIPSRLLCVPLSGQWTVKRTKQKIIFFLLSKIEIFFFFFCSEFWNWKKKRKKKNFNRIHSHEYVTVKKFQKTRKRSTHTVNIECSAPTHCCEMNLWCVCMCVQCLFLWMKKEKNVGIGLERNSNYDVLWHLHLEIGNFFSILHFAVASPIDVEITTLHIPTANIDFLIRSATTFLWLYNWRGRRRRRNNTITLYQRLKSEFFEKCTQRFFELAFG